MVDSRALARVLYYGEGLWSRDYVEAFPNVEQLVYSWTPADLAWALVRKGQVEVSMEQSWPSVQLFEMRHGRDPSPLFEDTPIRRLFPSLRRVNLVFCILERWLPLVAAHNTVIKLKVFMVNDGEVEGRLKDWPVELWERIEDLSVRLRSPRRGDGAELESGDYFHLQGFQVRPSVFLLCSLPTQKVFPRLQLPATSPLRTLSISTHLSAHFVLDPRRMRDVVTALSASFSFASLTSLSLDEYATATPNDLHRLAAAFPALRRLSLGDRIVWEGSRVRFSPLSVREAFLTVFLHTVRLPFRPPTSCCHPRHSLLPYLPRIARFHIPPSSLSSRIRRRRRGRRRRVRFAGFHRPRGSLATTGAVTSWVQRETEQGGLVQDQEGR